MQGAEGSGRSARVSLKPGSPKGAARAKRAEEGGQELSVPPREARL